MNNSIPDFSGLQNKIDKIVGKRRTHGRLIYISARLVADANSAARAGSVRPIDRLIFEDQDTVSERARVFELEFL